MLGFLDQSFSINTPFHTAPRPIPLISWSLSSCSRESTQLLLRFLPPLRLMAQTWGAGWQLSHEAVWRRKAELERVPMGQAAHSGAIVLQTWPLSLAAGSPSLSSASPSHLPSPRLTPSSSALYLCCPASLPVRLIWGCPAFEHKQSSRSTEGKGGKKLGEVTGGGREQRRNQSGRLRGMKATTEQSVFSGLVERWPSLTGTGTTSPPRCSRYQSVLRPDLHQFSSANSGRFFLFSFLV